MLALLITLLASWHAAGNAILLSEAQLFQPAITMCVNDDTFLPGPVLNHTDCDNRAAGCETTTLNCHLSEFLGYTLPGTFMDILPTIFSAIDPVTADGKVNWTAAYHTPGIFSVQGFVQLWQYVSTDPMTLVDTYKFVFREQYILEAPGATAIHTFNDLMAGTYVLVYWDVGGTRFGLGVPEMSNTFAVQSVFPQVYPGLEVRPMLQDVTDFGPYAGLCANPSIYFTPGQMGGILYPFSHYRNTYEEGYNMDIMYFSYQLVNLPTAVDFIGLINNAPAVHNRKFIWEYRTDQGNVINVKTEPYTITGRYDCNQCNNVNMTDFCGKCLNLVGFNSSGNPSPACASCSMGPNPHFCDFCGGITANLCNTPVTIEQQPMTQFLISPMISGSYGTTTGAGLVPDPLGDSIHGIYPWTRTKQGRKTHVAMRLAYVTLDNSEYIDYWRMRQGFGDATTVASKVLDIVSVDLLPVWQAGQGGLCKSQNPAPISQAICELVRTTEWNHFEHPPDSADLNGAGSEDWFVAYYLSYRPTQFGLAGSGGQPNVYADYYSWNEVFRNNGYWGTDKSVHGQYVDNTHTVQSILGGQIFTYKVSFPDHFNMDDYSCRPVGTQYANDMEFGKQQYKSDSQDPQVLYQGPRTSGSPQAAPLIMANPSANRHVFADITWGTDYAQGLFNGCSYPFCPAGSILKMNGCNPPAFSSSGPQCCSPNPFSIWPAPNAYGVCPVAFTSTFPSGCGANRCCSYNTPTTPNFPNGRAVPSDCSHPGDNGCGFCCNSMANIWWYNECLFPGATPSDVCLQNYVRDSVCQGYVAITGFGATADVYIGASQGCDLLHWYNQDAAPLDGSRGDPSNDGFADPGGGGNLAAGNPFVPISVKRDGFRSKKDCAAGPFPRFYVNANQRLNQLAWMAQMNFPYYQLKVSYPNRPEMLNNPISGPVFLIPGYVNSALLGAFTAPPQPLTLSTAPVYNPDNYLDAQQSPGTMGLDTHSATIQYNQWYYPFFTYGSSPGANKFQQTGPTDDYGFTSVESDNNQQGVVDKGTLVWNTQMVGTYARFKVYPTIIFRGFRNAVPARGALPAIIDVEFRVACPFLSFYQYGRAGSAPAYCAEGWYITNQANQAITLGVKQGAFASNTDPLSLIAYSQLIAGPAPFTNQILASSNNDAVFILTIAYQQGDVLHWAFNLRAESEKPYGTVAGVCSYSTTDVRTVGADIGVDIITGPTLYYVPDQYTVPEPPVQYVLLPLLCRAEVAAPACSYNTPEMGIFCVRGSFFAWETIVELNLPGIGTIGAPSGAGVDNQFVFYYFKWTLIGQGPAGGDMVIQGFGQQFQTFSPPFAAMACDHVVCVNMDTLNLVPPPPSVANPLKRPPRCVEDNINDAACPVNLADTVGFSGINQQPFCLVPNGGAQGMASGTPGGVNAVLLTPRLVFNPPYTLLNNVGSIKFSRETGYIDPLFYALTHTGIFEQDAQFVVDEVSDPSGSVFISLWVQYGLTIASHFEPFCYDNMETLVRIISSFVVSPGSITRVPGCSRADDCCYFLPLTVAGTSPYTGLPVTLSGFSAPYNTPGNATDLCYNTPACVYEVLVSPPYNVDGGICLGTTYSFTVQTPQVLVDSRVGPPVGFKNLTLYNTTDFHFAYRCPSVFEYMLPIAGFTQPKVETIPGPCNNPGNDATFTVQYTDPVCRGPISAANTNPQCRRNLFFALEAQNGDPTYNNLAPVAHQFTRTNPNLISGIYTLTYNTPGLFEFPNFYTPPPMYIFGGFPSIPNGYWNAYFWVEPSSVVTPMFSDVTDARNMVTVPFIASLRDTVGLTIARTYLRRPRCPGPDITIGFIVQDLSYRGPYAVVFTDPSGQVIAAQNYTCGNQFCVGSCLDILTNPSLPLLANPQALQSACDLQMQGIGIQINAGVHTGFLSPGENGAYTLAVGAEGSMCGSTYVEFMDSLDELFVQIECKPSTCSGGRDGNVNTVVTGGTQKSLLQQQVLVGSHFDLWIPLYNYSWSTPQGPQVVPSLLRVPDGFYELNVTDANGCPAPTVSCTVGSRSPPMELVPAGSVPPNCTGNLGTATFRVVNGTAPYTLYRVSNRTTIVASGYEILSDSSSVPNVLTLYVVEDALGCFSPEVSFTLGGPINFNFFVSVDYFPCTTQTATGQMRGIVTPIGLGAVLVWTNVNTGQVVCDGNSNGGCLVLTDAPAASYKVVATAVLYGCVKTVLVNLEARAPPSILFTRSAVSTTVDRIVGSILSDNGPPYTITFFGIPPHAPSSQQFLLTTNILGQTELFVMQNVIATTTFEITVVDRGNCTNTVVTYGRTITVIDLINTPTALPQAIFNKTQEEKLAAENKGLQGNLKLIVILLTILAVSFLILMWTSILI
jgi:hypothetical protein